jgi:hypothetical protein
MRPAMSSQIQELKIMMNLSLTLPHVDVGVDQLATLGVGQAAEYGGGTETSLEIGSPSHNVFDELFEKLSPVLSALYLTGAIGFSAVLVFNAFAG